jgi:uncharacterized protein YihD (DUF1040 family)
MSKNSENKRKLVLTAKSLEHTHGDPGKTTSLKHNDHLFSFSSSPKFPMQMITELQDQVRLKEVDLIDSNKAKKRLEIEVYELKALSAEKDKEINRLTEENLNLKTQVREGDNNLTEYWKKEVLRKHEGLKKVQEQMKLLDKENKNKIDLEIKKIIQMFEDEKKYNEAKKDILEKEIIMLKLKIKEYEDENNFLKSEKPKSSNLLLEKQLEELEEMQLSLIQENSTLKQELEIIRRGNNLQDLVVLSSDIHKISRQVHSLLAILRNLKQGKEVSVYFLLEMDETKAISSSRQLVLDVSQLKKDLNEIKEIVSDYHAELLGGALCHNQ